MSVFYFLYNLTYAAIVVGCAYIAYQRKNRQYRAPYKALVVVYYASILLSTFLDPIDTVLAIVIRSRRVVYFIAFLHDLFYYAIPSSVVLLNIILAIHMYHMTLLCKFHFFIALGSIILYTGLFSAASSACYFFYNANETCQIISRAPQYTTVHFVYSLLMQTVKLLPMLVSLAVLHFITKISVMNYYEVEHENLYLKMRENELYVKWQQNQLRVIVYMKVASNFVALFYAYAVQMWGSSVAQAVLRYFIQSAAIFVDCYAYAIVVKRPQFVQQCTYSGEPVNNTQES